MGNLFLILCLLLCGVPAYAGASHARTLSVSEKRLLDAFGLFQNKEYEKTLAVLSEPWPADFLLSPEALYLKVKSALALGNAADVEDPSLDPWRAELSPPEESPHKISIRELVEKHRFKEARQYLQNLEESGSSPLPEELYWLKGRTLFGLRRYEEALAIFQKLAKVATDEEIKTDSIERRLSTFVRLRRYQEITSSDYEEVEKLRGSDRAAKLRLSIILESDQYSDLLSPSFLPASERSWWKGWAEFQMGQYNQAYLTWVPLNDIQAKYWKARALEKMGQPQGAKRHYQEVAEQDPLGYYGWMALWRSVENQKQAFAFIKRHWVAENLSLPRPVFRERSDLHLQRTNRLLELGLSDFANRELSFWYSNRRRSSADDLVALSLAQSSQNSAIGFSLAYAYKKEALQTLPPSASVQKLYWELAYPKAYKTFVEKQAAQNHLEPALVYALIRAESSYKPNVVSPRGAIGLMQLMPETAERVALALNKISFQEEDLFQPEVNIELGTMYLQFLQTLFPEHFMVALAGYNAGEEATARWLGGERDADFDAFVEEIPYKETEGYVKKIYQSYFVYQWLYPSS